jgi:hypothetical protein
MGQYEPVIPKDQLVHGKYYCGECRNAGIARWNGYDQVFYYWRTKFGDRFLEPISCPEDDQDHDVFIATAVENNPVEVIPFLEVDIDGSH